MRDRAVFLDRDGVLIEDRGYVQRLDDVHVLPGVAAALDRMKRAGWLLVVVTNQSGIGRGLFTADAYAHVTAAVRAMLPWLDAVYHCPHRPDTGCACRKPHPGMLLQAARDLGIDLGRSIMLGDCITDVQAGQAAGCRLSVQGGVAELPEWAFLGE